MFEENLQGEEE